jgi:hypothetical protein
LSKKFLLLQRIIIPPIGGAQLLPYTKEDDGKYGSRQKHEIKPPMKERKRQVTKHLCNDKTILRRHIHAHQQNGTDEVHAGNFGNEQHQNVQRIAARKLVK